MLTLLMILFVAFISGVAVLCIADEVTTFGNNIGSHCRYPETLRSSKPHIAPTADFLRAQRIAQYLLTRQLRHSRRTQQSNGMLPSNPKHYTHSVYYKGESQ